MIHSPCFDNINKFMENVCFFRYILPKEERRKTVKFQKTHQTLRSTPKLLSLSLFLFSMRNIRSFSEWRRSSLSFFFSCVCARPFFRLFESFGARDVGDSLPPPLFLFLSYSLFVHYHVLCTCCHFSDNIRPIG